MTGAVDVVEYLADAWQMAPVFWSLVLLAVVLSIVVAWRQERSL